jgi:N-acetyltransferase 10
MRGAKKEDQIIDFRRRFISLLSFKFREFGSVTALSVIEAANAGVKKLDQDKARGASVLRV